VAIPGAQQTTGSTGASTHDRMTVEVVCAKNGVIRPPNGLKLHGNILALPGIVLKITGTGVENVIGRSQTLLHCA
jgi:hypothetical protein